MNTKNTKKNLTVAALAALLAVPAFNATNAHAANIPIGDGYTANKTSEAIEQASQAGGHGVHGFYKGGHYFDVTPERPGSMLGTLTGINGNNRISNAQVEAVFANRASHHSNNIKPNVTPRVPSNPVHHVSENTAFNELAHNLSQFPSSQVWDPLHTGNKGADSYGQYVVGSYTFDIDNGQSIVNGRIVPPSEALNDLLRAENDNGNNNGSNTAPTNPSTPSTHTNNSIVTNGSTVSTNGNSSSAADSENNVNRSANSNNAQSEYQNSKTNNGKLVQTGENDGASKAAALGATALTASIGLTALSFAKRHKENIEAAELSTDNVRTDSGNNKPQYSSKSNYDMIMSHTFASLSKDLK